VWKPWVTQKTHTTQKIKIYQNMKNTQGSVFTFFVGDFSDDRFLAWCWNFVHWWQPWVYSQCWNRNKNKYI